MNEPSTSAASSDEAVLDVSTYLRPIWRRRWLIIAIVVIAAAGAYLVGSHHRKLYTTSADVYIVVADPATPVLVIQTPGFGAVPPDGQQMTDITVLITAQPIEQAAYRHLGLPVGSGGTVTAGILDTPATVQNGTSMIVVSATSPSPTLAARLVNAYVSAFLASRTALDLAAAKAGVASDKIELAKLEPKPSQNANQIAIVSTQIAQLEAIESAPGPNARQIGPAPVPTVANAYSPRRDAVFGGVIGLLLSLGVVFGLELFDRRIMGVSEVQSIYERQVLAVVPHVGDTAPIVGGNAVIPAALVEAMRSLQINVRLAGEETAPRTIAVTSAVPLEGKSTIARNLALVYADAGERTLLIDADLRNSNLPDVLGLDGGPGLAQVLRGDLALAKTVQKVQIPPPLGSEATSVAADRPPSRGSLDFLAHGEFAGNPAALLSSRAMEDMLTSSGESYDVVVVDTAPMLTVPDALILLGMADVVLLVARVGLTTRDVGKQVSQAIERVPQASIAGLVVNDGQDVDAPARGYGASLRGSGGRARRRPTANRRDGKVPVSDS
jgi:polysaccharide biosynthesis transport protein